MSAHSLLVRQLPCHCCDLEGVRQPFPTESHHCNKFGLAGKERMGDLEQVPLCGHHHRGLCLPGHSVAQMAHKFGPSLAHDKKQFRACYGTDKQHVAITLAKIERLCPVSA